MRSATIGFKTCYYTDGFYADAAHELVFGSFYAYSNQIDLIFKNRSKQEIAISSNRLTIPSFENYHVERYLDPATDLCHTVLLKKDVFNNEQKNFVFYLLSEEEPSHQDFFKKINHLTSIPLMEEWGDYIYSRLTASGQISRCSIEAATHDNLQLWQCASSDVQILNIITTGLENRYITIDASRPASNLETGVRLDTYLTQASDDLIERVQEKFSPRFNPVQGQYRQALLDFEDWCYNSGDGIQLFDAQKALIESGCRCLSKEHRLFTVGEMGTGKLYKSA